MERWFHIMGTFIRLERVLPSASCQVCSQSRVRKGTSFCLVGASCPEERDQIIAAVNRRYHKQTHKFGIEVPKTVKHAFEIDKENGNTFWQDAINQEMKNIRVAFNIMEDGKEAPPSYQYMECHMVFVIKWDGFK